MGKDTTDTVPAKFSYDKLNDPDYKADDFKVSVSMAKGPVEKRRCTDLFCLIGFLCFIGVMGWFCAYGYMYGQVGMLLAPSDSDGRICGYDAGVENNQYLWISDIQYAMDHPFYMFSSGVCVDDCPESK